MRRVTGLLAIAWAISLWGCGEDPCTELAANLAMATSGEVVTIANCTANGDIDVPPGVTLSGDGESRIIGNVTLRPGSTLRGLEVESLGPVAVSAVGPGEAVTISDVRVAVAHGAAMHIADRGATLSRVSLIGNVDDPDAVPADPSATDYSTHGLLLSNAGTMETPVSLTDVSITRFARFGALLVDSHATWRGGRLADGLSTGLMTEGGSIELEAVQLGPMMQGVQVLPAFGAIFSGGSDVHTQDVLVMDNQGYGMLHDAVTVTHENLVATGNGDAALWVQSSASFSLIGEATEVSNNVLAGLVIVDTTNALVRGATFGNNTLGTRITGSLGRIDVGDGIHAVIEDGANLIVDQVTMTGNERAGVLLDAASGNLDGVLMEVTVDGTGDQLGAIAQGPEGLIDSASWDLSVTRLGDTTLNDEALADRLSVVEIVGPMFLPPPSM